jgi:glutaredoxin-like YruB-family protein
MDKVTSHSDFIAKTSESERSFLFLYKNDGGQSTCAYHNIEIAISGQHGAPFYSADVSVVKDIHPHYGVGSVPSLLVFNKGNLITIIKGCHDSSYYKALSENSLFTVKDSEAVKPKKRVTVYSTPTCSWCNTLKAWLQKNNITYTDVDISRDQRAAEELVRRSGQQGVPQTDVNGSIVVGFNQPLLKELLGI